MVALPRSRGVAAFTQHYGMTESTSTSHDRNSAQNNLAADPELAAIQTVLNTLTALEEDSRQRVIEYVFRRLSLTLPSSQSGSAAGAPAGGPGEETHKRGETTPTDQSAPVRDIRSLKTAKQPRSAIEMAVLVAYYLAELAPMADRKTEIGTDDITKYFKQADFPLPGRTRKTLFDAKAAGYLDSSAQGSYKLNPVGHNLVAHSLPASGTKSKK
jgi:hypothetical protein